jgi:phosphate transport system protein
MIKEILAVFKTNTLMEKAFQRSYEMLDITLEMFLKAKNILRKTEHIQTEFKLDDQDIEVNKYQREVRRDVFNHLVLSEGQDLTSGLVLVSIVIDIERIGDYTKNIVEIATDHHPKLRGGIFEEELLSIEEAVEENFKKTIDCFKSADEKTGMELLSQYKWVSRLCDKLIRQLINGENVSIDCGSAVALALYLRSLKRIYSHLRNVTTSVVNPFDRIGYKPKK